MLQNDTLYLNSETNAVCKTRYMLPYKNKLIHGLIEIIITTETTIQGEKEESHKIHLLKYYIYRCGIVTVIAIIFYFLVESSRRCTWSVMGIFLTTA